MALTVPVSEIVEKTNNPLLTKHESWERVLLGDIATVQNGFAFKSSQFTTDEGMPLIRIRDVGEDGSDTFYKGEYDPEYVVQAGDLLVGMDGDFKCARWRGPNGLLNQRVCRIILHSEIYHSKFLDYALPGYLKAIHDVTSSVTVKHLSSKSIKEIPLPLPPFDLQTRIVAEIEKQFSRLDEAVANLKRVKANLKRYKAAVLKAAVEGKLTEEWRKIHVGAGSPRPECSLGSPRPRPSSGSCPEGLPGHDQGRGDRAPTDPIETGAELLERILEERRANWQGRGRYKEPVAPDTSGLPELPEGWVWARAEQLTDFITKGTTPSSAKLREGEGEVRFLKVYNLTFTGSLDYHYNPAFVDRTVHLGELARSKVFSGDVLINIVGPPLGQVSIVPSEIGEANINQAIARFRPLSGVSNKFLATILMTESIMSWAIRRAKTTAGQSNLTLELCRDLPIPLPPFAEQHQIVAEVERHVSIIADAEVQVEANLHRADRLRQSILKQAFSGQLVPQNPSDEPASVLLERIRANTNVGARRAVPLPRSKQPNRAQHAVPLQETKPAPAAPDVCASLDAVIAAILDHMQPGREYSRADLTYALGLSSGRWNAAIQELKRRGQVRQVGERRGARYRLGG